MLVAAVLIAAGLAACGDDDPAATGTSSADGTAAGHTVADTTSEQIRSNVKTGPLRMTGEGLEQFRDVDYYSTLDHGIEANDRAMAQAARVVHGYLVAHVQYDWATACSYLDEQALESVASIGSHFEEIAGGDCPTMLAYMLGKVPAGKTFVSSEVKAGVLRIRREGGYFFYRAGGDPYTVGVSRDDDGNWKLADFSISKIEPPPS